MLAVTMNNQYYPFHLRPKFAKIVTRNNNYSRPHRIKIVSGCHSALVAIVAIWSLGCWLTLWMTLQPSLTGVKHSLPQKIANHGGFFEEKLRKFFEHKSKHGDFGVANKMTKTTNSSDILRQIVSSEISSRIQSTLISHIGYPQLILGAYLEPPLQFDDNQTMMSRTYSPHDLTHALYPYKIEEARNTLLQDSQTSNMGACFHNGAQWTFPTFHPPSLDYYFEGNVDRQSPIYMKRWKLALGIEYNIEKLNVKNFKSKGYCPVDADPFLPWIHDVFPSRDGNHIEFIISNKRRCNTDPNVFQSDLNNLEPQVTMMQPIAVKRLKESEFENDVKIRRALGRLWSPASNNYSLNVESFLSSDITFDPPRYHLASSLNDGANDGKFTRFICRFHSLALEEQGVTNEDKYNLKQVILGETLSIYPYNPEHANYLKKGSKPMLTTLEQGHDEQIWNSVYQVRCPVPQFSDGFLNLTTVVASGKSVSQPNGVPALYVDLVPIRTPVRRKKEAFGILDMSSPYGGQPSPIDPTLASAEIHFLPYVEASGRWSNIPICQPPSIYERKVASRTENEIKVEKIELDKREQDETDTGLKKNFFLVACVWASHSFSTRGQSTPSDSSTSERLREFLAYHTLVAGFDHIYVYDNSDTSGSVLAKNNLAQITSLFPKDLVTRIPWPHRVCNNNRPGHSNPGERSSQYAAEASCRARYGPETEWMASLDVDEYLIPVGKQWKNIRQWLKHVSHTEKDTEILSFFQTRALPNVDTLIPYNGGQLKGCEVEIEKEIGNTLINVSMCAMKNPNKTFMETYNCEPTTHPKPESYAWRAKKQIYKPDFVLNHFVHYPVVTRLILEKPLQPSLRFQERAPYERRVNELTEGFMLHTKTTSSEMTSRWYEKCPQRGEDTRKSVCFVGVPSNQVIGLTAEVLGGTKVKNHTVGTLSSSFESNCFRHRRVMNEWVPKLESSLEKLPEYMKEMVAS